MAWTYSGWESETEPEDRLTQGRLFLRELTDAISASTTAAGTSTQFEVLQNLYDSVSKRVDKLAKDLGDTTVPACGGGFSFTKVTRA